MSKADDVQPDSTADTARLFAEIALRSRHLLTEHLARQPDDKQTDPDELGIGRAFSDLAAQLMANPAKLAEAQMRMWSDYMNLWQSSMQSFLGQKTEAPADKPDPRFKGELWENNFLFDYIRKSYLIAAQNVQQTVAEVQGLDPQNARKVKFFTRQFVDALSPSNFVFTNPEVLQRTVETGGQNLLEGFNHLLQDLDRGHGKLAISMTDYKAFKLGQNVASTPGKVVFQNDLMQLLQYEPSTPDVFKTPLLIIPPWINKYYILDLREKNSFIRWACAQGHTVFIVSWVNPDERHARKTFDDYLVEGPLAALDAIEKATGEHEINVIGYCLGGTLFACLLAWLAAKKQKRVKSATFFTTLIDFREPGELGVFVDKEIVANLEKRMAARGYLEGSEMAGTFNMLRANDLIWSFVVNNYLMGKEPFPFDLLYWNSDATRMPAAMHTFYLRNMYIENNLCTPGSIELAGVPIDLSLIKTPAYFISTLEDHIAPWKSTYLGAALLKGPVRFVLGGSGHIAGIVNPPAANKYWYWTREGGLPAADDWLATADKHEGSWWTDWENWIAGFGGEKIPARHPGDGKLKVIEDAPGTYAKFRLDEQDGAITNGPAAAQEVESAPDIATSPEKISPAAAKRAPRKKPRA
jgi:polyhydroxyalkanoate synthase